MYEQCASPELLALGISDRAPVPADLTAENLAAHLQVLIDGANQRVPVLSDEDGERFEEQGGYESWRQVGEVMLQAVQSGEIVPGTLTPLLHESVSERLASQAFGMAASSISVEEVSQQHPMVGEILSLGEVPDEQIGPTLRGIRELKQTRDLQSFSDDPEDIWTDIRDEIIRDTAAGNLTTGITRAEHALVANRYQMARCAKLIAFAGELLEHRPSLDQNNRITLPSGTIIGVVPGQEAIAEDLLDASSWIGRVELHDRVFRVKTQSGYYILKEHKGGRHAFTIDLPDMFTADSEREAEIAADFMPLGTVTDGDVSVSWEKPIGFVRDPSGFDFSMFAYEENLIPREKINDQLKEAILVHRTHYETEYLATQVRVQEGEHIDWDTFAQAKAYLLVQHAREMARKVSLQNGYVDEDNGVRFLPIPDHEFRIHTSETGVNLELIGMDFEHFQRPSHEDIKTHIKSYNRLIEKNPVDTANILVRGLRGDALTAAKAIVARLHAQRKRHLPEKIPEL
ncbi:MAG TPA: hypothetical protein VGO07_00160 [Candidatus Saccharimonadales bacterium]|jgi:hypothetical protein|nr:hypothetical protein [Candidatus Saccharimonadales bacterium]